MYLFFSVCATFELLLTFNFQCYTAEDFMLHRMNVSTYSGGRAAFTD